MTPAERNRRKAPELAAIVDSLRELYGTVRVEWVRMADGECLGPVPPEIAADMLHGIPDRYGEDGRGDQDPKRALSSHHGQGQATGPVESMGRKRFEREAVRG